LKHFDLIDYFDILPTKSELKILISKLTKPTNKHIAIFLSKAPKTIENQINSLNLKINTSIEDILYKIYQRYMH